MRSLLRLFPIFVFATSLKANELRLANLFADGAVLQREMPIPVWGTASPGEQIRVTFGKQTRQATTAGDGRWQVTLSALKASTEPRTLTVASEIREIVIQDVVVGEVWLCSGQSNMAMRVDLAQDAEREKTASDLPLIRVHTVAYTPARRPSANSAGDWVKARPATVGRFSATGFYFGRELHQKLDVPIGLIVAARGGSDITAWTSRPVQESVADLRPLLKSWDAKVKGYTPEVEAAERAAYEREYPKWKAAVQAAAKNGRQRPQKPTAARTPVHPADHHHHPATLFNGMIHPLIPYALRGVIWYQGESNAFTEKSSALYEKQLPLLVKDWRQRWGQGDFPVAWIQLPFSSARQVAWGRIRESMRRSLSVANTGMVVTLDLGEENLLHPKNKQAFAHRLALWASAEVYGEDIVWSGPLFKGARAGEKGVVLRFEHNHGLKAITEPLLGFQYRSGDGAWKTAPARIHNARVVVYPPSGATVNAYAMPGETILSTISSMLPDSPRRLSSPSSRP